MYIFFTIKKMIYNPRARKYIKYENNTLKLDKCEKDSKFCKWEITLKEKFD